MDGGKDELMYPAVNTAEGTEGQTEGFASPRVSTSMWGCSSSPGGSSHSVNGFLRKANGRLTHYCLDLTDQRIQTGGTIWIVLRHLHNQGHVEVNKEDLEKITDRAPELKAKSLVLPVILATIQALACTPCASETLLHWACIEGHPNLPCLDNNLVKGPQLQPWNKSEVWPFGIWALAAQVVNQFLQQGQPKAEQVFLASLSDLYLPIAD